MGDALDILSVTRPSGQAKLRQPITKSKKGDGVSREVAGLVGPNEPISIVPTISFKEKRKRDKPVHWEWKAFANSARTDGVMFYHWQKDGVQWDDYPFARFNRKVGFKVYTDVEYERYFQSSDWSKAETDELMTLCRQYDLRFVVIHDRFPFPRTIEDIKDRYYTIQRKLVEIAAENTEDNVMMKQPYNKEYELERKDQLERIFARSKEIEEEEQSLLEEAKKLHQIVKKKEKERKKAMELAKQQQQQTKKNDKTEKRVVSQTEVALMQPGTACLRSQLMQSTLDISSKTSSKIATVLDSLGMSKPLASEATAASFHNLRESILRLIDWQKYLQKKKFEYDAIKSKKNEYMKASGKTKRVNVIEQPPPVTVSKKAKK